METETEEPAPDAPAGNTPAPSEYAGLKVADLKEKLREQELPVSGTKAELLARLEEAGDGGGETAEAAIDYSELSQKELKAHRKEVNEAAEVLRIKRDEMIPIRDAVHGDLGDRVGLVTPDLKLVRCQPGAQRGPDVRPLDDLEYLDDAASVRVGQWTQQHRVHDAENGGRGADAQP